MLSYLVSKNNSSTHLGEVTCIHFVTLATIDQDEHNFSHLRACKDCEIISTDVCMPRSNLSPISPYSAMILSIQQRNQHFLLIPIKMNTPQGLPLFVVVQITEVQD
jgi:hypothetical protein